MRMSQSVGENGRRAQNLKSILIPHSICRPYDFQGRNGASELGSGFGWEFRVIVATGQKGPGVMIAAYIKGWRVSEDASHR